MRASAIFFVILPLCTAGSIAACVGDDPAKVTSAEAGTDGSVPPVATPDASDAAIAVDGDVRDVAADAPGPTCIYPAADAGAPGSLDQSFANSAHPEVLSPVDGEVDASGNTYVLGAAVNCVSATSEYDLAVHKFGPTGAADATFGTAGSGRACVHVGTKASLGSERPSALRIDPAGNIVIVGTSGNGGFNPVEIVVARFKPTGQLDTTFGTNGVYTAPIATMTFPVAYAVNFDRSVSPAKILVAGADGDAFRGNTGGFVWRLTASGAPDNGFNAGAPIVDKNATGYYGVASDATGSVFATGSASPQRDLIVAKWTQAGVAAAFGTAGRVTLSNVSTAAGGVGAKFSEGRALVPLPGGQLLIGGLQDAEEGPAFVARLTAAGALDTTFARTATLPGVLAVPGVKLNSDYAFSGLRTRCDGRHLAWGSTVTAAGGSMSVARVSSAGTLETFGDGGVAVSVAPNTLGVSAAEDPTSGRIVLMGRNAAGQLVLERYLP